MDKVDRALESSRKAYAELMTTRTRQLDRQVERVDDLRVTAGLDDGGEPADPAPQIAASRTLRAVGAGSDRP
jgi:DNA anti-recombination protein RmuC